MVFQNYALYPHMTVAENMGFSLGLARTPKDEIERRVRRAAEILGLTPISTAIRASFPAASASVSPWAAPSCAIRRSSCSTSRCPISMPSCACDARRDQGTASALGHHDVYVTHDQIEAMTMADRIVVMRDGIVEQIGAPLDLYDRPANLFVASFIGSPAMNFIEGTIGRDAFEADGGFTLPLPPQWRSAEPGRRAIYGVRPENVVLGGEDAITAEVIVVEPTGAETQITARWAQQNIVGVFRDRHTFKPGETIQLSINREAIHLFDSETGVRLEPLALQ